MYVLSIAGGEHLIESTNDEEAIKKATPIIDYEKSPDRQRYLSGYGRRVEAVLTHQREVQRVVVYERTAPDWTTRKLEDLDLYGDKTKKN